MDNMGNDIRAIMLTGSSGYLGSTIRQRLSVEAVKVLAPTRAEVDLTVDSVVRSYLDGNDPELIVHCAAMVPESVREYSLPRIKDANIAMARSLFRYANCPIIFISSMTVYSGIADLPAREDNVGKALAGYARGKFETERILLNRGFPGDAILRLPGLFGLPRRSGLVYNAVSSFLQRKDIFLEDLPAIWSAMAVHDAAECIVRVILQGLPPVSVKTMNIGYGEWLSVQKVIRIISEVTGYDGTIHSENDSMSFLLDTSRFEALYGTIPGSFGLRVRELQQVLSSELRDSVSI